MPASSSDPDLPLQVLDALRPIQRRLHAERTISPGKLGILRHLVETGSATAGELATRIRVSPQAVSLSTRELEELGLVVRERDEQDRRRIWFGITDAGRARYAEETRAGRAWLARAIDERLTAAETQALVAALPALVRLGEEDRDA